MLRWTDSVVPDDRARQRALAHCAPRGTSAPAVSAPDMWLSPGSGAGRHTGEDVDLVAPDLDPVGPHRLRRGQAHRLAVAQAEARGVQRALDLAGLDPAVRERGVLVRARVVEGVVRAVVVAEERDRLVRRRDRDVEDERLAGLDVVDRCHADAVTHAVVPHVPGEWSRASLEVGPATTAP